MFKFRGICQCESPEGEDHTECPADHESHVLDDFDFTKVIGL